MRRTMLLGVLLAMGAVGIVAGEAPQQANVAEIEKVRDNLFMMEFGEFNAAFLAAVRQVIDAGKTVDEAVAGLTLPEQFKDYGMQNAKDNVAKIYAELKSATPAK